MAKPQKIVLGVTKNSSSSDGKEKKLVLEVNKSSKKLSSSSTDTVGKKQKKILTPIQIAEKQKKRGAKMEADSEKRAAKIEAEKVEAQKTVEKLQATTPEISKPVTIEQVVPKEVIADAINKSKLVKTLTKEVVNISKNSEATKKREERKTKTINNIEVNAKFFNEKIPSINSTKSNDKYIELAGSKTDYAVANATKPENYLNVSAQKNKGPEYLTIGNIQTQTKNVNPKDEYIELAAKEEPIYAVAKQPNSVNYLNVAASKPLNRGYMNANNIKIYEKPQYLSIESNKEETYNTPPPVKPNTNSVTSNPVTSNPVTSNPGTPPAPQLDSQMKNMMNQAYQKGQLEGSQFQPMQQQQQQQQPRQQQPRQQQQQQMQQPTQQQQGEEEGKGWFNRIKKIFKRNKKAQSKFNASQAKIENYKYTKSQQKELNNSQKQQVKDGMTESEKNKIAASAKNILVQRRLENDEVVNGGYINNVNKKTKSKLKLLHKPKSKLKLLHKPKTKTKLLHNTKTKTKLLHNTKTKLKIKKHITT